MKVNCLNFADSKDSRYLFLYGSELIIKQDIADQILESLKAQDLQRDWDFAGDMEEANRVSSMAVTRWRRVKACVSSTAVVIMKESRAS